MSDKRPIPLVALAREPRRGEDRPSLATARPQIPPRGRHPVGVARVALRRVTVARAPVREVCRIDRRREQMPLPPGFVDRRRAA
ncbi:MAG: hypothetical protein H6712_27610 [Myxococcales bacterium]|nr:hypothetical protein [Myxococcales bacterium]MCB9717646.1 hypothetical protein [Myxococcales bacterium]